MVELNVAGPSLQNGLNSNFLSSPVMYKEEEIKSMTAGMQLLLLVNENKIMQWHDRSLWAEKV